MWRYIFRALLLWQGRGPQRGATCPQGCAQGSFCSERPPVLWGLKLCLYNIHHAHTLLFHFCHHPVHTGASCLQNLTDGFVKSSICNNTRSIFKQNTNGTLSAMVIFIGNKNWQEFLGLGCLHFIFIHPTILFPAMSRVNRL